MASHRQLERRLAGSGGTLSADQRTEIASDELKELQQRLAGTATEHAGAIDLISAMIRDTEAAVRDAEKESWEFNRDVVVRGESRRTGRVDTAVVARWMAARNRALAGALDKLRLRNTTMERDLQKSERAAARHEEGASGLHDIDFHQLKIENAQYLAKIKERNRQLMQLKVSTGGTMQALAERKQRLAELTARCQRLRADISSRTATMERLRAENRRVGDGLERDGRRADRLGVAVDESEDLPGVQDYVSLRAEHAELGKELSSWVRKVDIAEMSSRKAASRATTARRALDSATPGVLSVMAATSGAPVLGSAGKAGAPAASAGARGRLAVGPAGGRSGAARRTARGAEGRQSSAAAAMAGASASALLGRG